MSERTEFTVNGHQTAYLYREGRRLTIVWSCGDEYELTPAQIKRALEIKLPAGAWLSVEAQCGSAWFVRRQKGELLITWEAGGGAEHRIDLKSFKKALKAVA